MITKLADLHRGISPALELNFYLVQIDGTLHVVFFPLYFHKLLEIKFQGNTPHVGSQSKKL